MKMVVFWVVAPCSLVEVYRRMVEAASTSETSVNFYQTTRRNNPEDSHIHTRRRQNLISQLSHYVLQHLLETSLYILNI
jgi:hypothetical protein